MTLSSLKLCICVPISLALIGLAAVFLIGKDGMTMEYKTISKEHQHGNRLHEKRNEKSRRSVLIIYWSKIFNDIPRVNFNPVGWPYFFAGQNCPIKCELTKDKRRAHDASALVIHSRNTNELPPKAFKNLTWILHTNENPIFTPSLRNPDIMRQFNYLTSYRLDSDFPCPGFLKPSLEPPQPFSEKTGLVIVALSHCEPTRTHYISALMNYIDVDSYGECLNNKAGLEREKSNSGHALMEMQRNYKFSLVFPNADCNYYMTEKIYSALSAGSVPVWLGTDKIDEVLKWGNLNKSVIKVKDFTSPKALAEYLLRLSQNEKEYNKYLKWKYEGFQFPKEYYTSPIGQWWDGLPLYCRICMKIAQDPQGHNGLPVDKCDGQQKRTIRKWIKNWHAV